ncbi:MAG TPA: family 10 glycosylhydrolase, partial [Chthonomonadaceae bacterium]|nr:family 10 glycosylhydrolase [Chthonomonadaceae bacterium]
MTRILSFPMAQDAHLPRPAQPLTGLLLLVSLLVTPAIAQSPVSDSTHTPLAPTQTAPALRPPDTPALEEMRGMWVVRDGLESPQSVHQVVVTAVKYHLNALFVQVRGRGDAWYRSSFEPRAEDLRWQPESFDPLEQLVAEAHAHGIQVHAWLNTFLTWSGSRPPSSPQHLWNAHRDWFAQDNHGRCSSIETNSSEGAFLQPSNPAVQQHLVNVYTEVARNYDVDGIHFDYCRYCGSMYDFSPGTVARFREHMVETLSPDDVARFDARLPGDRFAYIHAFRRQWDVWRRQQVTDTVARISASVKAIKPWMQVSAAV